MIFVFDGIENNLVTSISNNFFKTDNKTLDWSKLKQIADDILKCI